MRCAPIQGQESQLAADTDHEVRLSRPEQGSSGSSSLASCVRMTAWQCARVLAKYGSVLCSSLLLICTALTQSHSLAPPVLPTAQRSSTPNSCPQTRKACSRRCSRAMPASAWVQGHRMQRPCGATRSSSEWSPLLSSSRRNHTGACVQARHSLESF